MREDLEKQFDLLWGLSPPNSPKWKKREEIKAFIEEYYKECNCVCHGEKYINDCYHINKGICESCGKKSAIQPPKDKELDNPKEI